MEQKPDPKIIAVIPAFRSAPQIGQVLTGIPSFITGIIVVDDASPDGLAEKVTDLQKVDDRIVLIRHPQNLGVGGAMVTGYRAALEADADIVVKMDSDGQMDPAHLLALLQPLLNYQADYTKGNRFLHIRHLKQMPWLRQVGNVGLSFLSKISTGYWNLFDPTNGYTAIRSEALRAIDLENLDQRFFFEPSMLCELYLARTVVRDVYMPARYGDEASSLSEFRSLWRFPPILLKKWVKRMLLYYFVRDFSAATVFMLTGWPLFLFGFAFGAANWVRYARLDTPAPTGTIMLAVLPIFLGIQLILQATLLDIQNVPRLPISQKQVMLDHQ
jgi:glycosyltransferase involved in cell wall biosynthesis